MTRFRVLLKYKNYVQNKNLELPNKKVSQLIFETCLPIDKTGMSKNGINVSCEMDPNVMTR